MTEKTVKKSKAKKVIIITAAVILSLVLIAFTVGTIILRVYTAPYDKGGVSDATTIARTEKGELQGRVNNDVYNFLGVEYARADKLFRPAEPTGAWEGVKTAFAYGPASMQQVFLGDFGSWVSGVQYDNDCQNLNVWTPEINGDADRPVMVWLHGGGFSTGSAYSSADYNGENLAKSQDVVVVSVNHRLNALGHFDLSEYGDEYKYSANVGIDDIVLALQWIRDNISAFGGDPDNVTLFGQSGGGAKILALMTSPYAKGLFHKAIVQSGATETVGVKFTSRDASRAVTRKTLELLGITADDIGRIDDVSYRDLMNAGSRAMSEVAAEYRIPGPFGGYAMEWEPVVDFDYIPTDPVTEDSFAENGKDIPLLIGSNLFEWTKFMSGERLDVTDEVQAAFNAAYPNEAPSDAQYADTLIRLPMLKIMAHKADQGGAEVYSYVFTHGNSTHGAELPYVFGNGTGEINAMMSEVWANFARNGKPSSAALPEWTAYSRANGAAMVLDTQSYMAYDHDKALLELVRPDYIY